MEVARRHGLELSASTDDVIDEGLDFQVFRAEDEDGRPWILRLARRPDVFAASRVENRALRLVSQVLPVEVPRWTLHCPQLIAYPMIEGRRGWSVDDEGNMSWEAVEPGELSPTNTQSIAETIAALQSVDTAKVTAAKLPTHDIDEVRQTYATWIEDTKGLLDAPDTVVEHWQRWLADDTSWPDHTALVHGDFHPGHWLFDEDGRLKGVLDWTEAKMWDPTEDLLIFFGCFGDEGLERMVEHFAACGGQVWPGIEDHVRDAWHFTPVKIAAWAIEHDDESVMEHARAQLDSLSEP